MTTNEIFSWAQETEFATKVVLQKRSSKEKAIIELDKLSADLVDRTSNLSELKKEKETKLNDCILEATNLEEKSAALKDTLIHLSNQNGKESFLCDLHTINFSNP